eukprot:gb/GECH01012257.1/.p1 GENE.gb/GECH01012257.1/~~gb/GECH01012257.1/.p1  ORF type:complete len:966 (+),score=184.50 gb/GECH01012257.1/:1-2898(+)
MDSNTNLTVTVNSGQDLPVIDPPDTHAFILHLEYQGQKELSNEISQSTNPEVNFSHTFTLCDEHDQLVQLLLNSSLRIQLGRKSLPQQTKKKSSKKEEKIEWLGEAEVLVDKFIRQAKSEHEDQITIVPFQNHKNDQNNDQNEETYQLGYLHICISIDSLPITPEALPDMTFLSFSLHSMINLPPSCKLKQGQSESDYIFSFNAQVNLPSCSSWNVGKGHIETEKDQQKIVWSAHRCFMLNSKELEKFEMNACSSKSNHPAMVRVWRTINQIYSQEGWEDENIDKFKGMATLVLQGFLEAGETTVSGDYILDPSPDMPIDTEEQDQEQEIIDNKSKKKSKKSKSKPKELQEQEFEQFPFTENQTSIRISVSLSKPLIPLPKDRPRPPVSAFQLLPRREDLSVERSETMTSFNQVIKEIVGLLARDINSPNRESRPSTSTEFVLELKASGKFSILREKLKNSVARVVREKFGGETNKNTQALTNDIYQFLSSRVHNLFNQMDGSTKPQENLSSHITQESLEVRLLRISKEAEMESNYEKALNYLEQRISIESCPQFWNEKGLFALRRHDLERANYCFREALYRKIDHVDSLHAMGVLLCEKNSLKEAEVFLQESIDLEPSHPLSWSLLAVLYDIRENSVQCGRAAVQADQACSEYPHFRTANFLIEQKLPNLAERAINIHESRNQPSKETALIRVKCFLLRKDASLAYPSLSNIIEEDHRNVEAWVLQGDAHFISEKYDEAVKSYEMAIEFGKEPKYPEMYLKLGNIYIDSFRHEEALQIYLKGIQVWPSTLTWLGAAHSYYFLDKIDECEAALNEANILDPSHPEVWALLSVTCRRQGRNDEADYAFHQAKRWELNNASLLALLGKGLIQSGEIESGEKTLLEALEKKELPDVRMTLAESLEGRNRYEESLKHYCKIIESKKPKSYYIQALSKGATLARALNQTDLAIELDSQLKMERKAPTEKK